MKPTVFGVVGGKKSGKTTTIEILTRELSKRGYKIAVAKHIPETNFTIDTEGKDTWRYAQAGAQTIVAASAREIAVIEKAPGELSLERILQKCKGINIVFLEGFRKLVSEEKGIYKIAVADSAKDIEEAIRVFGPIIVFTGSYAPRKMDRKILFIDVLKHGDKIADLVGKLVNKKL